MEEWQHRAWHAIRDTIARYTWSGDFGDVDGFAGCFTPDAVLEIKHHQRFEGYDELRQLGARGTATPSQQAARDAAGPRRHHVSSLRIEVPSPDVARAWSYFLVLGRFGLDHWGRYSDELVPQADRWVFRSRRVSIDGVSPESVIFPDGLPAAD